MASGAVADACDEAKAPMPFELSTWTAHPMAACHAETSVHVAIDSSTSSVVKHVNMVYVPEKVV
jgi:hypothetical protein